jgi:hypothetical protein
LFRTAVVAGGLALLAVLLRRPDLLYLAAPIALAAAVDLVRPVPSAPSAELSLSEDGCTHQAGGPASSPGVPIGAASLRWPCR